MTHHDDADDALFARMSASDPVAGLPRADRGQVTRLLEDVLTRSHDAGPGARTESRETGARGRSPLTWLVTAAAVALIAAAGAFAVVGRGGGDPAPPAAQQPATVTRLTMQHRSDARCMVPDAQVLGHAVVAVDAEVVSVSSGVATLDVSHWYAGEETGKVTVDQSSADRQDLTGAPVFEPGKRYLVAATSDRQVMVCGYSGRWSEHLAALYHRAFA